MHFSKLIIKAILFSCDNLWGPMLRHCNNDIASVEFINSIKIESIWFALYKLRSVHDFQDKWLAMQRRVGASVDSFSVNSEEFCF